MLEEPYEGIYQKFAYKETYVIKNGELKKIKVRTYMPDGKAISALRIFSLQDSSNAPANFLIQQT